MFTEENRPEPPMAADPVEMLSAFLDFQRATLLWKTSGLTEEQLRRAMTDSGVSLLGMVKHCAYVERWWFQIIFAGRDVRAGWTKEDFGADWRIEPEDTGADIFALYERECAVSREIVAGASWQTVAAKAAPRESGHTLGWVLSHMLEEISRHVGQADILRERIDGSTGE